MSLDDLIVQPASPREIVLWFEVVFFDVKLNVLFCSWCPDRFQIFSRGLVIFHNFLDVFEFKFHSLMFSFQILFLWCQDIFLVLLLDVKLRYRFFLTIKLHLKSYSSICLVDFKYWSWCSDFVFGVKSKFRFWSVVLRFQNLFFDVKLDFRFWSCMSIQISKIVLWFEFSFQILCTGENIRVRIRNKDQSFRTELRF